MNAIPDPKPGRPDQIVETFRAIRQELGAVCTEISDIKTSLTGIQQQMSDLMASDAAQESTITTIQTRLDRIERRLDISEG